MSKYLFLIGKYFPNPSPNSICVREVMLALKNNNVDVSCVAINENNLPKYEFINEIHVYRIKGRFANRILSKTNEVTFLNRQIIKLILFYSRLQGAFLAPLWPFLSIGLVIRYYLQSKKIIEKGETEVIVSIYKGIEALLAGVLIKKRYPKIKLILYNLDCMSGSLVPKIRGSNMAFKSIYRWEKLTFNQADAVCIMHSHKSHYNHEKYRAFKEKFILMDIPLFKHEEIISVPNQKNNNHIRLVFTGSMSEETANPTYFIKILESIFENFILDIYGGTRSISISTRIKNSPIYNKKIFWHGIVSPEIAAKMQQESDVLISFGNDNECMIPSKIFEYIASRKHVIHLYKSHRDSSIPYFKKYMNATLIKEDVNLLSANIETVKSLISKLPYMELDRKILLKKFEQNTPFPMANFLSQLINS